MVTSRIPSTARFQLRVLFYWNNVNSSYSAKQVLGKPNVYPRYGDIHGTWTQPRNQLDRVHFIEVGMHSLYFSR